MKNLIFICLVTLSISAQKIDTQTPLNSVPLINNDADTWMLDWTDEFNGTEINLNKWLVSVSTKSRAPRVDKGINDWWWKADNAFLDGTGNLALRGEKIDHNTMHCGSVETRNIYEPLYGYLEARIKIAETAKANHTAFWMQGHSMTNGQNDTNDNTANDGAEVDFFESAWNGNYTKAVVHYDGYAPGIKNNKTKEYQTPNLHSGFHVFGVKWTATSMKIYYDGVFKVEYNGIHVPQVAEWLWLSVGASFGDGDFVNQPVGILSDALVDYVRVWKLNDGSLSTSDKVTLATGFKIYSNPANKIVNIHPPINVDKYNLVIYDQLGRLIKNTSENKTTTIDVSNFSKGLYCFKIQSYLGQQTFKIIVN